MPADLRPSYNIVGAGIFGASTALHLIRRFPDAKVRLFDRQAYPCQLAASWDWNKVVRADYTDLFSMKLALEAKKIWASDPLFSRFYRQDGMFWISDTSLAQTVVDLYKQLNADENYNVVNVSEAVKTFCGLFEDSAYTGVSQVLINKTSGWAEAKEALVATIQAAVDAGVEYIELDVKSLLLDKQSDYCYGVRCANDQTFKATHTILCTGAGTASLLADSAPDKDSIQVGKRMIAAAICTGLARLSPEDMQTFQNAPVCCQEVLPGRGGSLPPTPRGEIKFWVDLPFSNNILHASGRVLSAPNYDQKPSQTMEDEVSAVKNGIFGNKGRHLKLQDYRICWDAITPDENFIVSPLPQCKGAYVATAGSFHGWKFLPTIGRYVADMVEGTLDSEMAKIWAWDRELDDHPVSNMWPKREMRDIVPELIDENLPKKARCQIL